MKQYYYEQVNVAQNAPLTVYLPFSVQLVKNGEEQNPAEIEINDIKGLSVRFVNVGETGTGRQVGTTGELRYRRLYDLLIVDLPAIATAGTAKIIVEGCYGCVGLRATIDLLVGQSADVSVTAPTFVFNVVGNYEWQPITPKPLKFTNTGDIAIGLGLTVYNDDEDDEDWHPSLQVSQNGIDWRDVEDEEFMTGEDQEHPFAIMPGASVYFRGDNPEGFNVEDDDYEFNKFMLFSWSHDETSVKIEGDIMSLIDSEKRVPMPMSTEDDLHMHFIKLFSAYDYEEFSPEIDARDLILALDTTFGCYSSMFSGCTGLTVAPALPATELAQYCYSNMFNGCTNLARIEAMFLTTPSAAYTSGWVRNVASNGVFVKNAAATWNVTGDNGVPTGWTIETKTA